MIQTIFFSLFYKLSECERRNINKFKTNENKYKK